MTIGLPTPDPDQSSTRMPKAARVGVWLFLGLLLVGAAYLYMVRGSALLFDLAPGTGVLCM